MLFVDTANLAEIKDAFASGIVEGVTTNPALLAKEPKGKFEVVIGEIVAFLKTFHPRAHLSVEVFSEDPDEILKQAIDTVKQSQGVK